MRTDSNMDIEEEIKEDKIYVEETPSSFLHNLTKDF
jgi:hypothetical protein